MQWMLVSCRGSHHITSYPGTEENFKKERYREDRDDQETKACWEEHTESNNGSSVSNNLISQKFSEIYSLCDKFNRLHEEAIWFDLRALGDHFMQLCHCCHGAGSRHQSKTHHMETGPHGGQGIWKSSTNHMARQAGLNTPHGHCSETEQMEHMERTGGAQKARCQCDRGIPWRQVPATTERFAVLQWMAGLHTLKSQQGWLGT